MLRWLAAASSFDAHLLGSDGLMFAHRQARARLAVDGDLHAERGGQLADQLEPVDIGLRPAQPEQHTAQVVAEGNRRVGGGVNATRGGHVVAPGGDAVGGRDRRLQAGAASLLDVEGGRVRRQRAAEHAFTHEVEVAAVLEDRAADHRAEFLAVEVEAVDEPAQRRREHVLVGGVGIGAVRSCERDSVAAEDGDPSAVIAVGHVCLPGSLGSLGP
jgi:hypothetical protein